jgi:hypothetical protein
MDQKIQRIAAKRADGKIFEVENWIDAAPYKLLNELISDIGTNEQTILISKRIYFKGLELEVPANVTLQFLHGGAVYIRPRHTVIINGPIQAGLHRIFHGVYPQWWGAVGNGENDDTDAIQNAINAIPPRGGAVYFPPGEYSINSPLKITSPRIALLGAGLGSQLINCGTSDLLQIGDGETGISNTVVTGLSFQTRAVGEDARHAPNTRIIRCSFSSSSPGQGGIYLNYSWCSTVTNSLFGSIKGTAIYATNSSNALWIAGNRIDGFPLTDDGKPWEGSTGIFLSVRNAHVVGNTIEAFDVGINLHAGGPYFISDYFEAVTTAIKNDTDFGIDGLVIEGCVFVNNIGSEASIDMNRAAGVIVRGNDFLSQHTSDAPIRITEDVVDFAVGPNRFRDANEVIGLSDTAFIQTGGKVGIGTTGPTSSLDVDGSNGYSQLRLRTSYTPTSTSDPNGNVGDISWDDCYIYVKTSAGWKCACLHTW